MVPLILTSGATGYPSAPLPAPAALPSEIEQQLVAQALGGPPLPASAQALIKYYRPSGATTRQPNLAIK